MISLYAGKNIQLPDDNILLVILRKLSAAVSAIEHSVALVQVGLYNCALVILLPTPHSNYLQVYFATLHTHDVSMNLSAIALTVGHAQEELQHMILSCYPLGKLTGTPCQWWAALLMRW